MKHFRWVLVANVGASAAAKRTDSCGDMEQLEMLELILVSEHETKLATMDAANARRARHDGWAYAVLSRYEYDTRLQHSGRRAT